MQKYSQKNLLHYICHVVSILKVTISNTHNLLIFEVPLSQIKYIDEAHFVSRDMQAKKEWGESREKVIVFTNANLKASYSLTVLTCLDSDDSTVICDIQENSNTQWDFLKFIIYCIQSGSLKVIILFISYSSVR